MKIKGGVSGALVLAVLGAILAALAIAGCGGGSSPSSSAGGGETHQAEGETGAASGGGTEAEAEKLTILVEGVPEGLDQDGPAISEPISKTLMVNLYSPLVQHPVSYTPEGGLKIEEEKWDGGLVESFSKKGTIWTFNLRKGVKSCAGNELTAEDVVYTFERAKSVSGTVPGGYLGGLFTSVFDGSALAENASAASKELGGEVKEAGKYSVQITQLEPNLLMLPVNNSVLSTIYDKKEMEAHATPSDPYAHEFTDTEGAAGFGAYCLKSWNKGSELVVEANPNWTVEPKPQYKEVAYLKVPNSSNRLLAVESGQGQVTTGMTTRQLASLGSSSSVGVSSFEGTENTYIQMNWQTKPWDNVKLRQAVAYALDYETIVEQGYNGFAKKWEGLVPSVDPGFEPNNPYKYDPEKAEKLLAEAGYPEGKGLSSFPKSSFELAYAAESDEQLRPVALQIQANLEAVGIPASLNPQPSAVLNSRLQVKHDLPFGLVTGIWPDVPDMGYDVNVTLISPENGGSTDSANYNSPAVTALWLEHAKNEPDAKKRFAALNKLTALAMKEVGNLPLVENPVVYVHSPKVTGFNNMAGNSLHLQYLRVAGLKYDSNGEVAK